MVAATVVVAAAAAAVVPALCQIILHDFYSPGSSEQCMDICYTQHIGIIVSMNLLVKEEEKEHVQMPGGHFCSFGLASALNSNLMLLL